MTTPQASAPKPTEGHRLYWCYHTDARDGLFLWADSDELAIVAYQIQRTCAADDVVARYCHGRVVEGRR